MSLAREVLIALSAGARLTTASGFDLVGRELAHVRIAHLPADGWDGPADGGSTSHGGHDPLAAWQAARSALRGLADRIPDLAQRAVGLAVTGLEGGIVAVDEDGDPIAIAPGPEGGRDLSEVGRDRAGARGGDAGSESAVARFARQHPEVLERTAKLLPAKDWVHFCLTGVAAVEPIGAALGFGARTSSMEPGLEGLDGLVPDPVGGGPEARGLAPAAAAACRLREGLPTVLAPPAGVAAAIGEGALSAAPDVGFAFLAEAACYLVRPPTGSLAGISGRGTEIDLPFAAGPARVASGAPGGAGFAWLLDLLQDVLGEVGLIGAARDELSTLLLRRAAAAEPTRLARHPRGGSYQPCGLLPGSSLGDLARATLEGVGMAARQVLADFEIPVRQLRVAGSFVADPLVRGLLAASIDRPLRCSGRRDAATAGGALVATLTLGIESCAEAAGGRWVEPFLAPAEAPDQGLARIYARAFEARAAAS